MELSSYLRLIWDSKHWLALAAAIAALVVYGFSASRSDEYESNTLGQIVSTSQASGDILSEEQLLSLSNVYSELADTRTVLDLAHEDEAVTGREEEFDESVAVAPESRIGVLDFTATTGDPKLSAQFANAYANAFRAYLTELQVSQLKETLEPIQKRINEINAELGQLSSGDPEAAGLQVELQALQDEIAEQTTNPGDSMRIVERAVPESTPVAPRPKRDALLALIAALVIGAVVVYLRDLFFDRYGSADDVARDLGLQLLGEIPKQRGEAPLEAFRSLRTAMTFALERHTEPTINGSEPGSGIVLITGAESGCGKSYVSANLARMLASEERRVAVVDGDLRRPSLHEIFRTQLSPGVSDLLLEPQQVDTGSIAVPIAPLPGSKGGELNLLPAGAHAEAAVESLSSARMKAIVTELGENNDLVLFDSPPTPVVVDPIVLSRFADGVVLVVDHRRTRRRDARRAAEALRATGAPILGFAFNRSPAKQSQYDAYRPSDPRRSAARPREAQV